jgi:hypothetical protein
MPGVYNLNSTLMVNPYISIEGSGQNSTKFTSNINDISIIISNSDMSDLSIEINGTDSRAYGIYADNATLKNISLKLTTTNTSNTIGIWLVGSIDIDSSYINVNASDKGRGIWAASVTQIPIRVNNSTIIVSSPYLAIGIEGCSNVICHNIDVTNSVFSISGVGASASSTGISSGVGGTVTIKNTNINSIGSPGYNGLAVAGGGTFNIDHSDIYASTSIGYTSGILNVGASKLSGPLPTGGIIKCIGAYDANYSPVICQ